MAMNFTNTSDFSDELKDTNVKENSNRSKNEYLWGEFCEPEQLGDMKSKRVSVNLTQAERDMLARLPRPLPLEGPRIHQPGSSIPTVLLGNPNLQKVQPVSTSHIVPSDETQPRDPYVLGGINLQNYATELRRVLNQIEERHSTMANIGKSDNMPPIELPPVPVQLTNPLPPLTFTSRGPFRAFPLPNRKCIKSKEKKISPHPDSPDFKDQTTSAGVLKTDDSVQSEMNSFKNSSQIHSESYKLASHVNRNILRKSVAAICTFQGFDVAVDAALDLITDAAANYLKKFCQTLRSNRDKQLMNSVTEEPENRTVIVADQGFSDVMDRTFREMGYNGGLKEIPEYYSHSVVGRYQGIVSECRQLLRDCHHQASLDAAYPNMASANSSSQSNMQSSIHLSTGTGQSAQIIAVSGSIKSESILEPQNMIPELHLPANSDDFLSGESTIYVGGGPPSILGAVLSGSQSQNAHPVHPLVHPTGSLAQTRTPSITNVGSNNVPTLSLDHNTPQIESGLQMLQSLEQGHFTVPGSGSQDGCNDEPEQSPTPLLSGMVGASPVPMTDLQSQATPVNQGSLLIKTSSLGATSKTHDSQSNVSLNSQSRKRRRTPESPFS